MRHKMKSIFIECNNGVIIPAWILDGRLWVMDGHGQTIVPLERCEAWWKRQEEVVAAAEQIRISYDAYAGILPESDVPKGKNIHVNKLPDFWPCPRRVEKLNHLKDTQDWAWNVDCSSGTNYRSSAFTNQVTAQLERAAGDTNIGMREFSEMLPSF